MLVSPDTTQKGSAKIDLKVLQHFAQFLLDKHFDEFLKVSMQLLRELNVPLLNLLGEEEAEKLGKHEYEGTGIGVAICRKWNYCGVCRP